VIRGAAVLALVVIAVGLLARLPEGDVRGLAAAAQNVAVPTDGERRFLSAAIDISLNKNFLRHHLRGAIEIDGVDGFVGTDKKRFFDAGVKGGFDDILTAENISLDDFKRVIFGNHDLFQGGGVDDNIGAAGGAL